ncbi:MAG: hypothetical protein V5A72_01230 [Candidatus Nanohaloarchaea archaeon]
MEEIVSKLPNREKKEALEILGEVGQNDWAEYHKNGDCISLRSSKR